ncbi:hypothetical protein [Pseudomonas sp. RIT-PI-AD]|uniref:outer membrane protein n=1 Tax=Pseudomonas sp. RIT-PI-AD TaxID=3035294 RepID=UPI0021D9287A|nr:hypothetical protein [Pseudomonas sp. RIT-PI-AD]
MTLTLTRFALAAGLSLAAVSSQAADFAGLTLGQSTSNMERSGALERNLDNPKYDDVLKHASTYGLRAGQESAEGRWYASYESLTGDYHHDLNLRQRNLLGSYDAFLPITDSTRLFGGATLGLTKLSQNASGYRRDSDIGYAVGLQAGILQKVADNFSVEGGYRYLRSNASVEVKDHDGAKAGSLDLHSTGQAYLGANYYF